MFDEILECLKKHLPCYEREDLAKAAQSIKELLKKNNPCINIKCVHSCTDNNLLVDKNNCCKYDWENICTCDKYSFK